MSKTSEGIIVPPKENDYELVEKLLSLQTLPQISRQLFVNDLQKAIGNPDDPHLLWSLKPHLYQLLASCQDYVEKGDMQPFLILYQRAVEACGQGWKHTMGHWMCSEQILCYSIYWRLKVALKKFQTQLNMFNQPGNDSSEAKRRIYQFSFLKNK